MNDNPTMPEIAQTEPALRPKPSKPFLFVRAMAVTLAVVALIAAAAALTIRFMPSAQHEIEAAYAKLDAAVRERNVAAFMSQLPPDYHEQRTMEGKYLSRADAEKIYTRAFKDWDQIHNQKADIYRMATRGNEASVIVERSLSGRVTDSRGLYGPKGKVHDAKLVTMEVDAWTKSAGAWHMANRMIASLDMFIDGKHFHSGVTDDDD